MASRRALGPSIRALREAIGVKHGEFAIQCQITPGYLSNIEKGVKQPSPAVLHRISNRLGVVIDAISYPVPDAEDAA